MKITVAAEGENETAEVSEEPSADGATALERLRDPAAGPWHVVVLDWHMPGMSGLELAVEIQADPGLAGVPLVMLSSAGPPVDIGTATAAGFAAFLTKPVTAAQLFRCLSRVLNEAGSWDPSRGPVAAGSPAAREPGRALRLLLVEDNPANQRVATMLLAKLGYAVEVAGNGALALAALGQGKFDAVLMDCQMPVMDGYEAARKIRAGAVPGLDTRVPIIALTAYARPEDRTQCLEAGMDDYVAKPIRAAELRAALERCGLNHNVPAKVGAAKERLAERAADSVFDEDALHLARELPGSEGASLLPELVRLYLSDEAERLERLGQLVAERASERLGDEAHSLGGNAASFGGKQVRSVALELERVARAGDWPAAAVQCEQLRAVCARLRNEITRLNLTGT